jgi:hypothetical protein
MVSKLVAFLTLTVLTLSIAGRAEAQPSDYRTYFTFSSPVTLPGITLPAGKYIFRLADPNSSRKVINVLSGDGQRSLAMLHTIPNQAMTPPNDSEIRFMETSAQVPPPVKTWWYAGRSIGYEFIYPRQQALQLAKSTSEPILTTTTETADLADAELSRITGSESNQTAVKVEDNPAPQQASGRAQPADQEASAQAQSQPQPAPQPQAQPRAQTPGSASASAAPQDPRADERASSTARTELPRTASSTPQVLVFGALAMALGLGLSLWSRVRA